MASTAVLASVALFAAYIQTIATTTKGVTATGNALFTMVSQTIVNVANPETFIGLLIGGSIAFLFSALAIRAVGRSADRQDRRNPRRARSRSP